MLQTTQAIALRTFRHKDSTVVLKAYTEAFGARSYLVRTGKRSGVRPAHLQALDRLELVVTEDRERELHNVREMRFIKPYVGIPSDPARGLLLLFAQEVFYRTLREEAPDPALFAFVMDMLEEIDTGPAPAQIPVLLLVRLAKYLGVLPDPAGTGGELFDLREGQFIPGPAPHAFCMDAESSRAFTSLLQAEQQGAAIRLSLAHRRILLEHLLTYFRMHVDGFGELRSPAVLHEVLH